MRCLIAAFLTLLAGVTSAQTVNELPLILGGKAGAVLPSGITYVAGTSAMATGSAVPLTINKPTTAANDVMLAFIFSNFTISSPPAGWTLINTFSNTGGVEIFWHLSTGGSEPANYTWTGYNPGGFIRDYRNASITAPIDANNGRVEWAGTATSCQIPAMSNTVGPNEVYVGAWDSTQDHTVTIPGAFGNAVTQSGNLYIVSADFQLGATGSTVAAQTGTFTADFAICAGVTLKQ